MATSATPNKAGEMSSRFSTTYETLLNGTDPSMGRVAFWDELFLLKVNDRFIRDRIGTTSEKELADRAPILNILFSKCVSAITDHNQIRAANAVQTLGAFMSAVFRKKGFATFGFDVVNVVMGFDNHAQQTRTMIDAIRHVLNNDQSAADLKEQVLCLLIVTITATESVNQNIFIGILMEVCIFDDLLKLLDERTERERHGFDVLLILGILLNYKKPETPPANAKEAASGNWKNDKGLTDGKAKGPQSYEARRWNVYAERLEELSDDISLNAIGSVLSSSFLEDTRSWSSLATVEISSNHLSSWLAKMFQDNVEEPPKLTIVPAECGAVLLSLYETVKLNPGFVTVIGHTEVLQELNPDSSGLTSDATDGGSKSIVPDSEPTNLLSTFLSFASFLMHQKDDRTALFHKLCWITFIRICEDDHANEFLHASEVPVSLYYSAMRHRPAEIKSVQSGPLATALLNLCIEFLMSHLKKGLHAELYTLCLGVIHRLLCYQKEKHIRLTFSWKMLWAALIALAGFLVRHEQTLLSKYDIFELASQVINIFNIFITYGDTFLPDPASYDQLYYEVIRVQSTFDALYDMAKRHERSTYPESAEQLALSMCNIRAIINHFNPLISRWKTTNGVHTLSPEQVLVVVNENYDSLTLKIKGTLTYDTYVEDVTDAVYFQKLVAEIMTAHRDVNFKATAIHILK